MVLNDEAHHTHDEDSEWNKIIRGLHAEVSGGLGRAIGFHGHAAPQQGAAVLLDGLRLSAEAGDHRQRRQAPAEGHRQGITEQRSDIASTRYQAYLAAGVERWKEYREQLTPLGKKPVLFVMMNDTAEADDVGDWLRKKYPSEFGGDKLLIIHTDRSGEVSKKDLDVARKASREVDDEKSPINCIVSVMMLREGWDVQGVTVIVGLRPYTSKANILPEQTVGRGLRLMFRGVTGYIERVDVIGNKTFIEFVEQLEREEDIQLETFKIGEKVSIVTIAPDPKKTDKDIAIPVLSPILTRKKSLAEEIAELDVSAVQLPGAAAQAGRRRCQDIPLRGLRHHHAAKADRARIHDSRAADGRGGHRLLRAAHRAGREAAVAVLGAGSEGERVSGNEGVRRAGDAERACDDQGDQQQRRSIRDGEDIRRGAAEDGHCRTCSRSFSTPGRPLSETPPFPWSRADARGRQVASSISCRATTSSKRSSRSSCRRRPMCSASPSCRSNSDLPSSTRTTPATCATTSRISSSLTSDGTHYIVETKGLEDINVANKDRAAQLWCENTTQADRQVRGHI